MSQNVSSAVMAGRFEPSDSLDFFPTPPWATRAFIVEVLQKVLGLDVSTVTAWESACGHGHMVRPMREYFRAVEASDVFDYGKGYAVRDFFSVGDMLAPSVTDLPNCDLIMTNPPFIHLARFIEAAIRHAKRAAFFCRIQVQEGQERFENLWRRWQGHVVGAVYSERVILNKGRLLNPNKKYLNKKTGKMEFPSSATAYAWVYVDKTRTFDTGLPGVTFPTVLIPPCRQQYERPGDYD